LHRDADASVVNAVGLQLVMQSSLSRLVADVHTSLLPQLKLVSIVPYDPVLVTDIPVPWQCVGTGNYAAVFAHPDYPQWVIKIYAPGRTGWQEEVEVYRLLGSHPAFSECLHAEPSFLILKRLFGVTLWDSVIQGQYIPRSVITDIDRALDAARDRGLNPHDVHGRNVMMHNGRGIVVDVSDFLQTDECPAWNDLKRAYFWIYRPIVSWLPIRLSQRGLNTVRAIYRQYRRWRSRLRSIAVKTATPSSEHPNNPKNKQS
jgi:hypothetical protein